MRVDISNLETTKMKYWIYYSKWTGAPRNYWLKNFNRITGEKRKVAISAAEAEKLKHDFQWFVTANADKYLRTRKNRRHPAELKQMGEEL